MTLTQTLQEAFEHQREQEWRRARVPEVDIVFSRLSGMDARDVGVFREVSGRGYLMVVRCPKVAARAYHGLFPAKNMSVKDKSGSSGLVALRAGETNAAGKTVRNSRVYVSDYDLMCVWRYAGGGLVKLPISAPGGKAQGQWSPEARSFVRELNLRLVSKIQHGCQDDYASWENPGVKSDDRFAAFMGGTAEHLPDPGSCELCYARHGLPWPYGPLGKYKLAPGH